MYHLLKSSKWRHFMLPTNGHKIKKKYSEGLNYQSLRCKPLPKFKQTKNCNMTIFEFPNEIRHFKS